LNWNDGEKQPVKIVCIDARTKYACCWNQRSDWSGLVQTPAPGLLVTTGASAWHAFDILVCPFAHPLIHGLFMLF
jgi:hypothetical protein